MDTEESMIRKLNDRIVVAEELLDRARVLEDNALPGSTKLCNKIKSELKFLTKMKSGRVELKEEHMKSTNLTSLEALLNVIAKTKNVCGVLQPFQIDPSNQDQVESHIRSVYIDIVSDGGAQWTKVIARKAEAIHAIWEGRGQYGEKSIVLQAQQFISVSEKNQYNFQSPRVCFYFTRGVTAPVENELQEIGVKVVQGSCNMEDFNNEFLTLEPATVGQEDRRLEAVNLDVTALLCLVSNLCHGNNNFIFHVPVLTKQAEEERKSQVLPKIEHYIEGKTIYACESAVTSFQNIVKTVGGPNERERALKLLNRVKVVDDNPSERTLRLVDRGKINQRSKVIFGTGDSLRAVTVTANTGFVRAAMQSGVRFSVFEHEARALTEIKEKDAEIINETR